MGKVFNRCVGYVKSQPLEFSSCAEPMVLTILVVEGIGGNDSAHSAGLNQIQSMLIFQCGMHQLLFIRGTLDGGYSLFKERVVTRVLKGCSGDRRKVHLGDC